MGGGPEEPGRAPRFRVAVVDPGRLSLAGHMVASLLRRSCADPVLAARAARLRGAVGVDAGGMRVCLEFGGGEVRVRSGACDRPRASLSAPLDALLDVALGHGTVGHVLRRRVRVGGDPFLLLRLLRLIRVRP
jgi:hypothetical protein